MNAIAPLSNTEGATSSWAVAVAAFLGLVAVYGLTAPTNHSLSIDAYYYALMITRDPLTDVENPRLFLWLMAMKGLYRSAATIVPDVDVFRVIGWANAIQASLAVVLFARLLERGFSLHPRSAWLTAALFASSYGIWRYASEIEVYASAVLFSLIIVHAAFALDRSKIDGSPFRAVGLGGLGGLGILYYQPIGIVAAIAVPIFLLARGRLLNLALYGAVVGAVTIGGFGLAYLLGADSDAPAAVFVLQTNHLVPAIPTLTSVVKTVFAVGYDLLSTSWLFAIEAFRERFRMVQGFLLHQEHMFAAENAGLLVWVAVATIPAAATLGLMAIATAWKFSKRRRLDAYEGAMIVWLAAHGAMMLFLSPLGFEGWIPGLVPLFVLAALRVVEPCVAAGKSAIVAALVAVCVLHNGLVGIGVQMREAGDYLATRGKALIERSGPGDLIVLAAHWNLERYLRFSGGARVIIVERDGSEATRSAIEATLRDGGRVLVLDDVESPGRFLSSWHRNLLPELAALTEDYLDPAQRFETGNAGWAYEILAREARP